MYGEMLGRSSLVQEASEKERQNGKNLNIIFLGIYGVLYYDEDHKYGKNDSAFIELHQRGSRANIKFHPSVMKKIPEEMLGTLSNDDLWSTLGFSTKSVENLRHLCDANNAKIVISSSWGSEKNLEQIKALFSLSNFDEYILDCIPAIRPKHVEKWLVDHTAEVNSFIILNLNDHGVSKRFSERYLHCGKLLCDDSLYSKAADIISRPLQFEKSTPKLLLNAIEKNSSQLTHVELNDQKLSALKIGFGWNTETLMNRLFSALKNNRCITHLTLQNFYDDEYDEYDDYKNTHKKELNAEFLGRLSELLLNSRFKLEYLNIACNGLYSLNSLLSILDGHALHIPHICFNTNPISSKEQKHLAKWLECYPQPITVDLDFSGYVHLHGCIIEALENNPHVHIRTSEDTLIEDTFANLKSLIESGRIELSKRTTRNCSIQ